MSNSLSRSSFVAGAAALAAGMPLLGRAADLTVIRAGTLPADVCAVMSYGVELGYFKEAGLDIQTQFMQSGPVIAPAVIGGSLDVGAANIASIAAARERGLPVKFFAPAGLATPATMTDPVMVRKDSPIKSPADLNGKTVAIVAMKTMQDAAFKLWVDKHGGDSKTVKLIEIPFPEMVAALDSGRVDAAIPSEPFASQGAAANKILGGVYGSMPGQFLIFGYFATDSWLSAHADDAVKFAAVIRKSALWANSHPKESAALITKIAKLDPSVAAGMNRSVYATSLDPAMIQPVIDNAVKYGMLDHPIDPNELIWKAPAK